jgi:N-acetylglucosaminyl-diphospho-decaprenol L-rhamnosyltransferase
VPSVDVVVVSFNSRDRLRDCVEPLTGVDDLHVIVVDNASTDGSLETVAAEPIQVIALPRNGGFGVGCNVGWRAGTASFVLFLNPDATMQPGSVRRLAQRLEENECVGIAAPRILHSDGSLDFSQRRFPRLRSTYARAFFLHRLFPCAAWADEVIRDERVYAMAGTPEWVSGACFMIRRSLLEHLHGFDEEFFLYCEDTDLCRRVWHAGYEVRFEPEALATHAGGASAPRASLLPVLAASRIRLARKHYGGLHVALERLGLGLEAAIRLTLTKDGPMARRGHARSLLAIGSSRAAGSA